MSLNNRNFILQLGISLHFVLILCIASLFMFGYEDAASLLTDFNMICIGYYWIFSIHKKTNIFSNLAFAGIALVVLLVQLININYAPLLYINIVILMAYLLLLCLHNDLAKVKIVFCIFAIPLFFTLLNMLSVQSLTLSPYARNAWDAAYIAAGIWVISYKNPDWIAKHGSKLIYATLFICTLILIQLPISRVVFLKPIHILGFQLSMGTQIFSTFISIFAAAAFMLAVYFLIKSSWQLKIISLAILVSLSLFILYVSWRPLWLGLIIGLGFSIYFCYKQKRRYIIGGIILLQIMLLITNFANFRDRMAALVTHSSSDERAVIWQDAWKMQLTSPDEKWLIGHGLMSFYEDFKSYSRFNLQPASIHTPEATPPRLWVYSQTLNDYLIDFRIYSGYIKPKKIDPAIAKPVSFRSPHNLLLDILYTSGLLGLIFIGGFYFFITRLLVKLSRINNQSCLLACLTLSALICNTIVNGLNFPFFLPYNLIPLAFICGTTLYIYESSKLTTLKV
jgi:O-antigen ligase